jgi:diaminohydroxyphosphoribosylaminopyrimidine deaminase/5-amino-6-(5-phosphoribosylamino)uracil reductase
MSHQQDERFMARALQLAKMGRYTTDPNPRVGCVLVRKGVIISEGWHVKAGFEHAEVVALEKTPDAKGATAYVTLEPCSHHGKTPPCCDALIKAGIARVVVAMQDPNPLVSGRGLEALKASGIEVCCGVLQEDAQSLNRGFIKRMIHHRPFIRSKLAMSLDGRTAMASGESQWITSDQARADVHQLRAESSAILTGVNTVLADDPSLNARVDWDVVQPIRIILDSNLKMPLTAKMAKLEGRSIILTVSIDEQKHQALKSVGFEVYEAGSVLNGSLLMEDLVDEWLIYMAPCVLGDQGRGLFSLPGLKAMTDKINLELRDVRQFGPDLKLTLS